MIMSSYKNVLRSKVHRERSQPFSRAQFGLLEKHGDYKQRARDYHRKERVLRKAIAAARTRNPDEYYYGMHSAKIIDGKHRRNKNTNTMRQPTKAEKKRMKKQDIAHLQNARQADQNAMQKSKQHMHLRYAEEISNKTRKHVIIVDDKKQQAEFDAAKHLATLPEIVQNVVNRPKIEQLETLMDAKQKKHMKKITTQQRKAYEAAEQRNERKRKLDETAENLTKQVQQMQKGRRTKIIKTDKFGDVSEKATIYKWKLQRKR